MQILSKCVAFFILAHTSKRAIFLPICNASEFLLIVLKISELL